MEGGGPPPSLLAPAVAALVIALSAAGPTDAAEPRSWSGCDLGDVRIEADFPGARANACFRQAPDQVAVLIMPERAGINPSPWYAFRVRSERPRPVRIMLVYGESGHRYWPKVSVDGSSWQRLPAEDVEIAADGKSATLVVDARPGPVWLAAQEIWDGPRYDTWLDATAGTGGATVSVLGWSGQRRPIHVLRAGAARPAGGTVVLVGRQHPPEVPGAFAFQHFVETLLEDEPLSRRFREVFGIVAVPNANPDGVALGHWRGNARGEDLNRDWGLFLHPETRLLRDLLASLSREPPNRPLVFLDFHATREDVFYTQRDEDPVEPPLFERRWLGCLQERMPDYPVNRKPGHNPENPTAKTWVYKAYGIPSVTFELGDDTPRETIAGLARQAAMAMMHVLLANGTGEPMLGRCTMDDAIPAQIAGETDPERRN